MNGMGNRTAIHTQALVAGTIVPAFIILIQLASIEAFRVDRIKHCFVSAVAFVIIFFLFRGQAAKFGIAVVGALLIGFFKEFMDPAFDTVDIFANIFGVSFGFLSVIVWNFSIGGQKQKSQSRHRPRYRNKTLSAS